MSDQTPIEKAPKPYGDGKSFDELPGGHVPVEGPGGVYVFCSDERQAAEVWKELSKAYAHAHVEAQRTPVSYAISKDYEALYDHLRNGGEALGRGYYKGTMVCHGFDADNSFVKAGNKAKLIDQCARLNLEWLAPAQPLSAQQVFDVVEEFIKQEAERVGTDQPTGLEYPVGHRHWNNMIADLRERLNKLIG